jgi:hypothetical protein
VYEFTRSCVICGPVEGAFDIGLEDTYDADLVSTMEKELTTGNSGAQLKLPLTNEAFKSLKASTEGHEGAIIPFLYKEPWALNRVFNR